MSMLLIQNANVYAPEPLGHRDLLVGGGRVLLMDEHIEPHSSFTLWDAQGKTLTPGIIDQHIHVIGAGGKHGFSSMTPEIPMTHLIGCGTTTVVGLLGTDGSTRGIKTLYAKCQSLEQEGITSYMYTGYFGLDPMHITNNVQEEMIFIDKVLGCKIAISDVRSSYPSDVELLRVLRQVRVGGMIGNKKGILHIHLGALNSKIDTLIRIVEDYEFPIRHISPTHMGRTRDLLEQGVTFAKMGGLIDISTGGTNYTEPHQVILDGLELGASMDYMSFSSDGNAGLDRKDAEGNLIGFRRANFERNLSEMIILIQKGIAPEEALKLTTLNPANNLGLKRKGRIAVDADADFCLFDDQWNLQDVFTNGNQMMADGTVTAKDSFD